MWHFLKKGVFFILIPVLFLFIGITLPAYPGASSTYLFAKRDKDSLLLNTSSPRILLMGGSNLALSVNSQIIRDSIQMNPVNTGLDCNIGLTYMIDNILRYVKKGDIVLLSIEYEQFFGRLMYGGYPCPVIGFEVSPWNWLRLSFNQWVTLLRFTPGYALARLKVWKYFSSFPINADGNYMRASFNQFGDHISHWTMKSKSPVSTHGFEGGFNKKIIKALLDFRDSLQRKEAVLLVTYPPYQASSYKNNREQIKVVKQALENAGFKILGNPDRYKMPDSLMFDSPYHMIKKGVDIRTQFMQADIRMVLQEINDKKNNG